MRRNLFWLSEERGRGSSRICRPMFAASSGLMIVASSAGSCMFQERLPLVRLPARVWPADDDLQPLRALGASRALEDLFRELARCGRSADTQMINSAHVKAPRGIWRKGGEKAGCGPFARRAQHEDSCTRRC